MARWSNYEEKTLRRNYEKRLDLSQFRQVLLKNDGQDEKFIEGDEVDIPFSRLEQISKVLNVNLTEIIGFNEKNVFNNNFTNTTNGFVIGEHINELKNIYEGRLMIYKPK